MTGLASRLEETLTNIPNTTLGVAVSGGSDSMALLHLLAARGEGLHSITIDHDLRDESADEAEHVAKVCRELGVQHTIVKWEGWDKTGNMQDEARRARQRLIKNWAVKTGVTHVALGHTHDDQAETVLLRLARGSGVDGLSGMASQRSDGPLTWVRPILNIRREELRTYLAELGVSWFDDPSNEDPKYNRVKARQALKALQSLGIDAVGLVETANRMRDAREALETATLELADQCATVSEVGEVALEQTTFDAAPNEVRYRLLSAALKWISGEAYRPRFDSLQKLLGRVEIESGQTLHGCVVRLRKGNIIIRREPARVEPPRPVTEVWDHRWVVSGNKASDDCVIAALDEKGLAQCPDWRETGHAREALLASPAIWSNGQLIAAPFAGMANGWSISLKEGKKGLHESIKTR